MHVKWKYDQAKVVRNNLLCKTIILMCWSQELSSERDKVIFKEHVISWTVMNVMTLLYSEEYQIVIETHLTLTKQDVEHRLQPV